MRMFVEVLAVYLHREPVDFRQSINGLSALVEGPMRRAPFSGAVFVFCNRRRDKLKILYWEGPCALPPPRNPAQFSPHPRKILPRHRPFAAHSSRQANRNPAVPCG